MSSNWKLAFCRYLFPPLCFLAQAQEAPPSSYLEENHQIRRDKFDLVLPEIMRNYEKRFADAGIILRDDQLHMVTPKNDFPAYAAGFDPDKTQLSIDAHGQMKGARPRSVETYFGPRIGSYGPDWSKEIPLAPNHHFVIEYFFYMPSPAAEGQDQYLLWWDHEEAVATESGIEYLSPPQKELILIR